MWNLKKKKTIQQTKQNETHRNRDQTAGCQGGGGECVKEAKVSTANDIVISLHVAGGSQTWCGNHIVRYVNVKSLYCIPESDITLLHTNYT